MKLSIVGGRKTANVDSRATFAKSATSGGPLPRRKRMSKRDRDLLTIVVCCCALAILLATALFS
jgi:hypothetical protein